MCCLDAGVLLFSVSCQMVPLFVLFWEFRAWLVFLVGLIDFEYLVLVFCGTEIQG